MKEGEDRRTRKKPAVTVSFVQENEHAHTPEEKFPLGNLQRGSGKSQHTQKKSSGREEESSWESVEEKTYAMRKEGPRRNEKKMRGKKKGTEHC